MADPIDEPLWKSYAFFAALFGPLLVVSLVGTYLGGLAGGVLGVLLWFGATLWVCMP